MTKFEEKLKKVANAGIDINRKEKTYYERDILRLSEGWVSPEEYEELVKHCAIYVLECKNINKINAQLTKDNEDLKSQLQQQALPVVPECVAEWIVCVKEKNNNALALLDDDNMPDDVNEWLFFQRNDDNINLILRAWLDGFTVEKPQLFYLKAKELLVVGDYDHVEDLWLDWNKNFTPKKQDAHKFTQQEIDSMETGSYEQIKVME